VLPESSNTADGLKLDEDRTVASDLDVDQSRHSALGVEQSLHRLSLHRVRLLARFRAMWPYALA
jgi:hypothetical protein